MTEVRQKSLPRKNLQDRGANVQLAECGSARISRVGVFSSPFATMGGHQRVVAVIGEVTGRQRPERRWLRLVSR